MAKNGRTWRQRKESFNGRHLWKVAQRKLQGRRSAAPLIRVEEIADAVITQVD
jgi:hypothetical protein